MGIYASFEVGPIETDPGTGLQQYAEFRKWPGHTEVRYHTVTGWTEHSRDNCFCCSCDDDGQHDAYCRNHGWIGTRRCEVHNMPGTGKDSEEYVDDDHPYRVDLVRLESVQKHNARRAEQADWVRLQAGR